LDNDGSRIAKIRKFWTKVDDLRKSMQCLDVVAADILLQAHELDPFHFEQGCQLHERHRANSVERIARIAGPGQADPKGVSLRKTPAPKLGTIRRRPKIWHLRRNVGKVSTKSQRQCEKRTVKITNRQGLPAADHACNAVDLPGQHLQERLN